MKNEKQLWLGVTLLIAGMIVSYTTMLYFKEGSEAFAAPISCPAMSMEGCNGADCPHK